MTLASNKPKWLPLLRQAAADAPRRQRSLCLYQALRTLILDGHLQAGDRLPSSRALAVETGLGRTAIEDLLHRLTTEGLIERQQGSGTRVAALPGRTGAVAVRESLAPETQQSLRLSARGKALGGITSTQEPVHLMPFNAAVADVSVFPWTAWREAQTRALRLHRTAIGTQSDASGWMPLRQLIARHLALYRGVRARPEQVLVFGSSQTALVSISMLLLNTGDEALIEDPGYPGARHAFEIAGAKLRPLPVDTQGLPVEGLNAAVSPKLVYLTPSHQYPTGTTLPLARRLAWLDAASERGFALVEDDYDGEFRYDASPIPAMQGLRPGAPVFYLGTFSKLLFPGFRLSYAVVPTWAAAPLANLKSLFEPCPPMLQQASLSCFMENGELEAHVRRMHAVYARKRDQLHTGLIDLRCGYEPASAQAGLHMSARLPAGLRMPAAREALRGAAKQAGLALAFTSDYALSADADAQLYLRYGGCSTEQIATGLRTLGQVTRECLRAPR